MNRKIIAGLFWLLACVPVFANCGEQNPNCVVPDRPAGDSTEAAANTKFVTGAGFATFPNPTRAGDIIYWNGASWTNLAGNNSGTANLQETSAGVPSWAAATTLTAPTYTRLTTGSGATYTPAAGIVRIKVRMAGGGGGGGGATANNGANGTDTSFGSWTAIHGSGGVANSGAGGAGGTGGVNGTGTLINRIAGGAGIGFVESGAIGVGGWNTFAGYGIPAFNATGGNAQANTGGGGAGGSNNAGSAGGGGGAGEFVEFVVTSLGATTYTVGPGGNGGAAGGNAGGKGADGIILIEEFYY